MAFRHSCMTYLFTTLVVLVVRCLATHKMTMKNHCGYEVWVGILGKTIPAQEKIRLDISCESSARQRIHMKHQDSFSSKDKGGFKLGRWKTRTIYFPDGWQGRVWGRTGCGHGRCETGDCGGGRLHCNGAGGVPPATLAEIQFDGYGGKDYYDVSLVDGYNLKMSMAPVRGTFHKGHDHYDCGRAGCNSDVNRICPRKMQVHGRRGVVACKSACLAFNTDRYCCRGWFNNPKRCTYFKYARMFKNACPDAYSYAYDDQKSTFTCHGLGWKKTSYEIIFC